MPIERVEYCLETVMESMDRLRDERRDRAYPAPPRDPRVGVPMPDPDRVTEGDCLGTYESDWAYFEEPNDLVPMYSVGDKVTIDPHKVQLGAIRNNGSSGSIGNTYMITDIESSGDYVSYRLEGENWHRENWLTLIPKKVLIGGRLL